MQKFFPLFTFLNQKRMKESKFIIELFNLPHKSGYSKSFQIKGD